MPAPVLALLLSLALATPGAAAPRPFARADLDTLARLEHASRWPAAESLAFDLAARLEAAPPVDSLTLADLLARAGHAGWGAKSLRDGRAVGALERAIAIRSRRRGDDDVPVHWRIDAARISRETDQLDRGLAHTHAAIAHPGAAPDSDVVDAWATAGSLYRMRQSWPEAIAAYRTAIGMEVRAVGPDAVPTASRLVDYGLVLFDAAHFEAARDTLDRAIRILQAHPEANPGIIATAYADLSSLEREEGNLGESVDLARRSWETLRGYLGENAYGTVRQQINLAFRLILLGDDEGAIPLLSTALPRFAARVGGASYQVLETRISLARALAAVRDTAQAIAELDSVDTVLRTVKSGPALLEAGYSGSLRAALLEAQGRHAEARALLARLLPLENATTDADGARRADLLAGSLATYHDAHEQASFDTVLAAIAGLERVTPLRSTSTWLDLLGARARAEARLGRRDDAWAHGLEAEDLALARLQLNVRALPDRRALGLEEQLEGPLDVVLAMPRPDDPGETRTAWDRLVRWRGLVREEIAARRPAAGEDSARAAIRADWVAKQKRYARMVVSGSGAATPELERARMEAEEAERRWVRARGGEARPDSASLDAVLARLAPGEALWSFAEVGAGTAARLVAFAAAPGAAPRRLDLGAADAIREQVDAWRAALETPPPRDARGAAAAEREARKLGERVRTLVWDPLRRLGPTAGTVDVVDEGPVLGLPWLALPARDGYLADGPVLVRVLGSERELLPREPAPAGHGLLAVGDPDLGAPGATEPVVAAARKGEILHCARIRPLVLAPLPGARAEAREIAAAWRAGDGAGDAALLLGAEATKAAFAADAPGRRVIHLATHGVVVDDSCHASPEGARGIGGVAPLAGRASRHAHHPGALAAAAAFSAAQAAPAAAPAPSGLLPRRVWLAFAGASSASAARADDGLLTAEEVVTLDLRGVEWVVLSACHSDAGESWPHEEALGMRRAFHLAGARSVIASEWSVDDAATREWMRALYAARHAEGGDAARSIRDASRAMLEARRRAHHTTHPFYWAAFTASGS